MDILVLVLFLIRILVRSRALRNIESKLSSEVSLHLHGVCENYLKSSLNGTFLDCRFGFKFRTITTMCRFRFRTIKILAIGAVI